jgi:ABC-type dipeptide/oligopeptide/nickel transport system permease component
MLGYVIRRILYNIVVLFGIVFLVFAVARLSPVDPVRYVLANTGRSIGDVDPVQYAEMRERLGLNRPIPVQFADYVADVSRGDFGESLINPGREVREVLAQGIPVSLQLAGMGLVLEFVLGILIGIVAAARQNSLFDRLVMSVVIVVGSIPLIVWGVIFIVIFGVQLRWLPIYGWAGPQYWILPVLTITITGMSMFARFSRATVLDQIRQDFVQTARAKGVGNRGVLFGHVVRNAAIPIVTFVGPAIPLLIVGNFVVETMFGIPGVAYYAVTSTIRGDYPMIQASVLLFAVATMLMNLVIDLLYGVIDPRIRLS